MAGNAKTTHGTLVVEGDVTLDGTDLIAGDVASIRLPVGGELIGPKAFATRAQVSSELAVEYPIDFTAMRVHTDFSSPLPGAPDGTSLGWVDGDWLAVATSLVGSAASGSAVVEYAAFLFVLPTEYDPAGAVSVRVRAATSASSTTHNQVDAVAFKTDTNGAVGADLVTTAAQAITTTTANKDFVVTPAGLAPGDLMQIRIKSDNDDTGGTTGSVHHIYKVSVLMDIRV